MSTMMVSVPFGAKPGSQLKATSPDGIDLMVTVPEGVEPGMEIQVQLPAPVQAAVVVQPAVGMTTVTAAPVGGGVRPVPPNCQPGGQFVVQKYCGPTTCALTWIGGCFFAPCFYCACCCPCDEREVYLEPGQIIPKDPYSGATLSDDCNGCNCTR